MNSILDHRRDLKDFHIPLLREAFEDKLIEAYSRRGLTLELPISTPEKVTPYMDQVG